MVILAMRQYIRCAIIVLIFKRLWTVSEDAVLNENHNEGGEHRRKTCTRSGICSVSRLWISFRLGPVFQLPRLKGSVVSVDLIRSFECWTDSDERRKMTSNKISNLSLEHLQPDIEREKEITCFMLSLSFSGSLSTRTSVPFISTCCRPNRCVDLKMAAMSGPASCLFYLSNSLQASFCLCSASTTHSLLTLYKSHIK